MDVNVKEKYGKILKHEKHGGGGTRVEIIYSRQ